MARKKTGSRSKKNRKFGRNKKKCELYRRLGKREKNKARRLRRHIDKHPNDMVAIDCLENLS